MVRTPAALGRSMAHLVSLLDASGATLQSLYVFISDRFRAVRTDIQAQQLSDGDARSWLIQQVAFSLACTQLAPGCSEPESGALGPCEIVSNHHFHAQLWLSIAFGKVAGCQAGPK